MDWLVTVVIIIWILFAIVVASKRGVFVAIVETAVLILLGLLAPIIGAIVATLGLCIGQLLVWFGNIIAFPIVREIYPSIFQRINPK